MAEHGPADAGSEEHQEQPVKPPVVPSTPASHYGVSKNDPSNNDATMTFTAGFAAQVAALGGDVTAEEQEAISALPSGSALLVVRRGPNIGARFLLDADLTTVGRHPEADIFLDDVTVSRRHSEFVRVGKSFDVKDLGSLNGTYVDGNRIEGTARLSDGAEVQVGKFRLTFYASRVDLARVVSN
jgi:pSer/pThr/pTyr-binding forkhead associated (FHA) protein